MNDSRQDRHDPTRAEDEGADEGRPEESSSDRPDAGEPTTEARADEPKEDRPSRREGGASTVAELELSLEDRGSEDDSDSGEEPAVSREMQLSSQIERLQSEVDANRDKWLRAMAEFENFRKRSRRELESSINLAKAGVLRQLLDVLDNFDRALAAAEGGENLPGADFVQGVRLIQSQLLGVLKENGVSRIEAERQPFDPNLHEAVSQIETDEVPSQHVAQVVKEGYRLNEMVLRPAMVVVAQ